MLMNDRFRPEADNKVSIKIYRSTKLSSSHKDGV